MQLIESAWSEAELDESILKLCEEYPDARMAECSRARERCRRVTPHGTPASLLTAMRETLRQEMELSRTEYATAA